jgi:uncharacterized protein YcfJ
VLEVATSMQALCQKMTKLQRPSRDRRRFHGWVVGSLLVGLVLGGCGGSESVVSERLVAGPGEGVW